MGDLSGSAFVQDWLAAEVGGERTALELLRLLPRAELFTSFAEPGLFHGEFDRRHPHTWPLQHVAPARRHFRQLLPLYPIYFGSLDLRRFSLVISGSVAFAHAVRTSPKATHISYVYTPMRYAWDQDAYLAMSSWSRFATLGARLMRAPLKRWDLATARRPDVVVAISETVRERIRNVWGRDAEVIYPPVDTGEIQPSDRDDGFLLVAARMLAYRRLDHAVEACTRMNRPLVVAGDGPERSRLQSLAGPSVRFVGTIARAQLLDLFARCRAYVVPGVEDFGIAPVEAMAAGKPVVAFGQGGVAETVVDGTTGVLYGRQDRRSLEAALERFDAMTFDPARVRARAQTFDRHVFYSRWRELLQRLNVDSRLFSTATVSSAVGAADEARAGGLTGRGR